MNTKTWAVVALISAVLALLAFIFWPKESPVSIAKRGLGCWIDLDADCLYDLVHPTELAAMELDKPAFVRYVKEYLAPIYAGASFTSTAEIRDGDSSGSIIVRRRVKLATGRESYISLSAVSSGKEPKVFGFFVNVFLATSDALAVKDTDDKLDRFRSRIARAEQDSAKLTALGVKGYWSREEERVLRWDEVIAKDRIRLQRAQGH